MKMTDEEIDELRKKYKEHVMNFNISPPRPVQTNETPYLVRLARAFVTGNITRTEYVWKVFKCVVLRW